MVRHLVFFKMKPEALGESGLHNAMEMAKRFRTISAQIPGVHSVELGMNYNDEENFYEMALNQVFDSRDALAAYTADPRHLAVRDFVRQVIDHRIVVDYDMEEAI
ncbi:MAG: Dabb family protein [Lachnospiraceae bacterium]|nr:Dabb family protein [Lachnospiraceae bacterium]